MRKKVAAPARKKKRASPAARKKVHAKGRAKKKAGGKKTSKKAKAKTKAAPKKRGAKPVSSRKRATKPAKAPAPPRAQKRAATAKRAPEPAVCTIAREGLASDAALKVVAVVNEGERGALVIGGDKALWAFRMPALDEALELPFAEAMDAWLSTNGALYLAVWMNPSLVRYHEGVFEHVPSNLRDRELMRVTRLTGVPGATPEADVLFGVDEPYTNAVPACRLFWRRGGQWSAFPLPLGRPGAIAASSVGEAFVSLGPTSAPERRNGLLFRMVDGELERLAFPAEEAQTATTPGGLHVLPDGRLLAFFGWEPGEAVRPWLRERDGTWSRLEAPEPFNGRGGRLVCREWKGQLYIPAEQGVFVWDGHGPIRRSDALETISLWPEKNSLIASGWEDGSPSQRWFDGKRWRPLLVPAPVAVGGGDGTVVYLGKGNEVPVREVRLSSSGVPPRAVRVARRKEAAH